MAQGIKEGVYITSVGGLHAGLNPQSGNFSLQSSGFYIKDGKLDPSNMIIEIDDDKTNSSEYVKTWLHRQLYLMRELFNLSNLYDYITVEIRHVGPIELDNYLVIFDIAERKDMSNKFKRVVKQTLVYGILFLIGFFIFF